MRMVEKVARALRIEAATFHADEAAAMWEEMADFDRESYHRAARAALEAMREPSEEMIMAGIIERHDSQTPEAWKLATANIYTAMIDAALAE